LWFPDEHLGKRHPVTFSFAQGLRNSFKDLFTLLQGKSCHLQGDDRLLHRKFLGKLKPDGIGEIVKDGPVGKEIILLVQQPDVLLCPPPKSNPGLVISTHSSPTLILSSPLVGSMTPAIILERVVFPAPDVPMIPKISL
jgi:hypothetical protein